jgi:hypothetical protein
VSRLSTTQKFGLVARVAALQVKRSRTLRALSGALATTARAVGRVLHQLWLEVTGLIFLVMATSGGVALAREYSRYQAGKIGFGRVGLAICFTATFAWFGVSSFWRVRQKGKGSAR